MKQGLTEEFKAYSLKQKSEIPLNIGSISIRRLRVVTHATDTKRMPTDV